MNNREWKAKPEDCARRCEEMEAGAEFLAAISASSGERIEHLKMAGIYRIRAQQAGGLPRHATAH